METNSETQQSSRNPLPQRAVLAVALVAIVLAAGAFGALIASGGDSDDADPITFGGPAASTPTAEQTPPTQASPTEPVDADDAPIPAAEIKAIEAAALKFAGGGSVTEIDRSDDIGEAFEVEVMTNAGEVDVALDDNLERVTNLRYDDDR